MTRRIILALAGACLFAIGTAVGPWITPGGSTVQAAGTCSALPTASALGNFLVAAPGMSDPTIGGDAGGLYHGTRMWGAVVNRDGELCAYATSTSDPSQVWPGSQAIAKAKAYTANAFSLDASVTPVSALSTALLYTFTQPGHSLWSLGQSNLFDTRFLAAPGATGSTNQITGGLIFFGGGVPLYSGGKIVGGLGISGDTSCADHEIAKRVRQLAGLNHPSGPLVDDIVYSGVDPVTTRNFTHPQCPNTYRNGGFIGNENPSSGY